LGQLTTTKHPKFLKNLESTLAHNKNKKKRNEIDQKFIQGFIKLLKICIPTWTCKELLILLLHSTFLILRTLLSLYVADLDGRIVSALVQKKVKAFTWGLITWMAVALPATFTNSMV
jgi:ATP-binding cassette subfamily D (ALD) long-chain fatty acid import protein